MEGEGTGSMVFVQFTDNYREEDISGSGEEINQSVKLSTSTLGGPVMYIVGFSTRSKQVLSKIQANCFNAGQ